MPLKGLDLFSGAGGASVGYHRAGFEMTGVDIVNQKRYPFRFIQADALEYVAEHGHEYDAIFASPPCQGYSRMRHLPWLKDRVYPLLIDATRSALEAIGRPWVIENVEDAPLRSGITLCGQMFGLPLYRHRRFESNIMLLAPAHPRHTVIIASGRGLNRKTTNEHGFVSHNGSRLVASERAAMGIDWMVSSEIREAIPPAYTEYIGRQIVAAIMNERAA